MIIRKWNATGVLGEAMKTEYKNMRRAGYFLENYIKRNFTAYKKEDILAGKAGKGQKVSKKGKRHYASRPGEPPAIRTGLLRASIGHEVNKTFFGNKIIGRVGVAKKIPYALALEYGFAPRNLVPRPYLRPALWNNRDKLMEILGKKMSK